MLHMCILRRLTLKTVYVKHGCYIGLKPNFTVWVLGITFQKLQELELVAEDETDLARKLFVTIFKEDLETRPNYVCCTEADGKELLNQQYLQGTRCKLWCTTEPIFIGLINFPVDPIRSHTSLFPPAS